MLVTRAEEGENGGPEICGPEMEHITSAYSLILELVTRRKLISVSTKIEETEILVKTNYVSHSYVSE